MTNEKLLPLPAAAREFLGRGVSPATLWRWAQKGVRGCRLKIVRVGGRNYVTRSALEEFAAASTAAVGLVPAERSAATAARLQAAGLAE